MPAPIGIVTTKANRVTTKNVVIQEGLQHPRRQHRQQNSDSEISLRLSGSLVILLAKFFILLAFNDSGLLNQIWPVDQTIVFSNRESRN